MGLGDDNASTTSHRTDVPLVVGVGVHHTFYIEDRDRRVEYEALVLLDECLAEWEPFFAVQGMATTTSA